MHRPTAWVILAATLVAVTGYPAKAESLEQQTAASLLPLESRNLATGVGSTELQATVEEINAAVAADSSATVDGGPTDDSETVDVPPALESLIGAGEEADEVGPRVFETMGDPAFGIGTDF